jgi:ATP-dependent helicase HepA
VTRPAAESYLEIGSLVISQETDSLTDGFLGVGKISDISQSANLATVSFFESPACSETRHQKVDLGKIKPAVLNEETLVFIWNDDNRIFRRARYLGHTSPGGTHRILFSHKEPADVPEHTIYVPNLLSGKTFNPFDFLKERSTDTPYLSEKRLAFITSYLEQKHACRSIGSLLCSAVEIEQHQIAVVSRIMQDPIKKYLLADEVGLGKTIEACLVLREHILQSPLEDPVVVLVPEELKAQWRRELSERFNLADLIDQELLICSHSESESLFSEIQPSMLVVDEVHQIAPWGWKVDGFEKRAFTSIAEAAKKAEICLILSGTPLFGNELNYLAILHLLSPDIYQLNEQGVTAFTAKIEKRELVGGIYQSFTEQNDNATLSEALDKLRGLFPEDKELDLLIETARPFLDWLAPDSGGDRATCVNQIRVHIGENYRLHQRMLRNRRDDPAISALLPGLSGLQLSTWPISEGAFSIDEFIDYDRETLFSADSSDRIFSSAGFSMLMDAYFENPSEIVNVIEEYLVDKPVLSPTQEQFLADLIETSRNEQSLKDTTLIKVLDENLAETAQSKTVIFCETDKQADSLTEILTEKFGNQVERHESRNHPNFSNDQGIRILVCDRRGEDGINLHGGRKIVIHYSIPRSFARIEQRNGRVNRYSADIFAAPIRSIALTPNRDSYLTKWIELLDDPIGIFEQSVAGLQYILQDELDAAWSSILANGPKLFDQLREKLEGAAGLISKERNRVKVQEGLESMNEEVVAAKQFAQTLKNADRCAELETNKLMGWITDGLQFRKSPGVQDHTFRFKYETGRTLINVASFVTHCITGIDFENSNHRTPVTAEMTHDRMLTAGGRNIYPLRFGQPFLNTIFDWTQSDPRGITSVMVRRIDRNLGKRPLLFLYSGWAIDSRLIQTGESESLETVRPDCPIYLDHWLDNEGEVVNKRGILTILESPYQKRGLIPIANTEKDISYRDLRINVDDWPAITKFIPVTEWEPLISRLETRSRELIIKQCDKDFPTAANREYVPIGVHLVMLAGSNG